MLEIAFWSSVVLVVYAYMGYPAVLAVVATVRNRTVRKDNVRPRVSFIITAYNEESRIREKLENTVGQEYPRNCFEVIVASDGSSDRTDDIVRSYAPRGVGLVRGAERKGKEAAQKLAVAAASGEVLVFSDVATLLASDGVSRIVRAFADPTIGCVSSVDHAVDGDGRRSGEGLYVKYEMLLRRLETKAGSLVGLSGSCFAVRRDVCREWATDVPSDFNTLLCAVKMGLRGVADCDSVGYYRTLADGSKEFERKVRTVLRGIPVVMSNLSMLNPFRYGLFSWQLFSHKLCRWLAPVATLVAFGTNAALATVSATYLALFIAQCGFYAIGVAGLFSQIVSSQALLRIPAFFVLVTVSTLHAWYRYVRGDRIMMWAPSER
jgi:glycosyltransferase involved in cell wall biosynthesis